MSGVVWAKAPHANAGAEVSVCRRRWVSGWLPRGSAQGVPACCFFRRYVTARALARPLWRLRPYQSSSLLGDNPIFSVCEPKAAHRWSGEEAEARRLQEEHALSLSSVDLRWRFRCYDRRRYRRGLIVFTLKRSGPRAASTLHARRLP